MFSVERESCCSLFFFVLSPLFVFLLAVCIVECVRARKSASVGGEVSMMRWKGCLPTTSVSHLRARTGEKFGDFFPIVSAEVGVKWFGQQ